MGQLSAGDVATITIKVAAYGGKLSAVFHSYALSAEKVPHGFEGAINILDATVTTLNQVLSLLKSQAEAGSGKRLFSDDGLTYVELLASECATTLAKIEPIVTDACLDAKGFKAKRRRQKRELAANGPPKINIAELELDEKAFLNTVECAKWSLASTEIEQCMERLYDLQLYLLLVFYVVTVGVMSTDLSSGKVDVKGIVAFHERIKRTAELVGIKLPKGRPKNKRSIYDSSSDLDSLFNSSDSDSDSSSILSLRRPNRAQVKKSDIAGPPPPPVPFTPGPPPPPPPANWPGGPPPPRRPWNSTIQIPAATLAGSTVNSVNPPSYSECKPVSGPDALSVSTSTLLGTVSQTSDSTTSVPPEKPNKSQPTIYSNEKEKLEEAPLEKKEEVPTTHLEPRLFKSNTKGLRFKVKSLFRSTQSLADEMKKALSDTDSHLLAVVIQNSSLRQIPHSAFHSLEATHMRTILSQLNDDTWYDTFTTMNASEYAAVERLLHPWIKGQIHERQLVVLKVIHEKKESAWVALLRDTFTKNPAPCGNGRVILAIVREKFLDGKPLPFNGGLLAPPPPPPAFPSLQPLNLVPAVRPPLPPIPAGLSCPGRSTRSSDLRFPPPPQASPTPVGLPTVVNLPVAGSAPPGPPPGRPRPPPGGAIASIRVSDVTPLTDYDAIVALTTYNEYTLHLAEPVNPGAPRSWSRVIVTQESAERHLILQRVQDFQRAGGNALQAKLRLNEQQGSQVTRLMDELKGNERDPRFEWCWVEISLYNNFGEITDFVGNGSFKVNSATMMHLIAKRMPKIYCKPMELYNSLTRPPPPPPRPAATQVVNTMPPAPVMVNLSRPPSRKSKYNTDTDSDSDTSVGTSFSSDNGSVGCVRRRLRKQKVRKAIRATWARDSDSDENENEDAIKIKLELKRGDDVVQLLLELWTPQIQVSGKGKEKSRKPASGVVG